MHPLFRFPVLLTRPIGTVVDITVTLLTLPGRVLGLVAHAEQTLAAANDAMTRAESHLERTGRIIGQLDGVVRAADRAVTAAAGTVDRVDSLTASAAPLLESYAEPLRRLEPTPRRMADTTAPHDVDALVTLIDRLPRLAHAMDGDVVPLLSRIEKIGPDLDQLLDRAGDLNQMMNRMPTMFRRHRENSPGPD